MIKVTKILLYDKKRFKHWSTVSITYKGLRAGGIVETNLKTLESKINWLKVSFGMSLEETEQIHSKGYKEGQDVLNEFSHSDKELIIKAVKESDALTKYLS